MSNPDMSPDAITRRLQRLTQLRELCIHLKQAGQKAGLHKNVVHNEPIPGSPENRNSKNP
jgi:hypothetical protein